MRSSHPTVGQWGVHADMEELPCGDALAAGLASVVELLRAAGADEDAAQAKLRWRRAREAGGRPQPSRNYSADILRERLPPSSGAATFLISVGL